MAWRSNPLVYEYLYLQRGPLIWTDHIKWWLKTKNDKDRLPYMIWFKSRKVGSVSLHSFSTGTPEVDVYIGETTLWGKGIAKKALQEIIKLNSDTLKRYKVVCARIMKGNIRSQKLFESCGFTRRGEGRPGEWYYEKVIK